MSSPGFARQAGLGRMRLAGELETWSTVLTHNTDTTYLQHEGLWLFVSDKGNNYGESRLLGTGDCN